MKICADTSALIAWFHPADEFASQVAVWCRERSPEFSWNPLSRIELRHDLRRLSGKYAPAAWHACRNGETSQKLRLANHRPPDLLEWGDEPSARHAQRVPAGTWDFVHVAAAHHVRAEIFITCDAAPAELAGIAALLPVHLFKRTISGSPL